MVMLRGRVKVRVVPKYPTSPLPSREDIGGESGWGTDLELMIDRDLSALVSQESVRASTSALSCSHASLLAGPSRPATTTTIALTNHTLGTTPV